MFLNQVITEVLSTLDIMPFK